MFLIYIWDLNVNDLMDPKVLVCIYKYVDDTKVITKITNEDDIIETQRVLDHVYGWQVVNNMMWNRTK